MRSSTVQLLLGWACRRAAHAATPPAAAKLVWLEFLLAGVFVELVFAVCGCMILGYAVRDPISINCCNCQFQPQQEKKKEVGKHGQHVSYSIVLLCTGCEPRFRHQLCSQQSAVAMCVRMCVCGWHFFWGCWLHVLCSMRCCWGCLGLRLCCRANKPGASGCPPSRTGCGC
jgi:hypothetical protein